MTPKTPTAHDRLFEEYLRALREALDLARKGMDRSLVRPPLEAGGKKSPIAADPRVIGVLRKYFMECERLNQDSAAGSFIYPNVFVLEKLEGKADDALAAVSELPYLPFGANPDGRWT